MAWSVVGTNYSLAMISVDVNHIRRGFRCCMSAEDQEDIDATEGGEEAYAGPLTVKLFAKRFELWSLQNHI